MFLNILHYMGQHVFKKARGYTWTEKGARVEVALYPSPPFCYTSTLFYSSMRDLSLWGKGIVSRSSRNTSTFVI